jgi:hypothetical protein
MQKSIKFLSQSGQLQTTSFLLLLVSLAEDTIFSFIILEIDLFL